MKDLTLNEALKPWYHQNQEELSNHRLPIVSTYSIVAMPEFEHTKTLWGLMNGQTGEIICEPRFTYVGQFVDGIAPCEIDDKVGYVKADATYLIEPTTDYEEAIEVVGGVCCIKTKSGKYKLYSCTSEKFLVDNEFDKVKLVGKEYSDIKIALFKVWSGKRIALIRADGIWVVTFDFNGYYFIGCDMIVATKVDGTQCLLNIATNRTLINNATQIACMGNDGYLSYYSVSSKKWKLAKLVGNELEVLLDNYIGYELIEDSCLVKCKIASTDGECFDIFNVIKKEIMVKEIENVEFIESYEQKYCFFEKAGFAGLLANDGSVILSTLAERLFFVTYDLVKVESNGFFGVFSLAYKNWIILPNFIDIVGPDKEGNFRCLSEISVGRKARKITAWRYMRSNGTLISREMFIKANEFNDGYAIVQTLDKCKCRLYENGEIEEY